MGSGWCVMTFFFMLYIRHYGGFVLLFLILRCRGLVVRGLVDARRTLTLMLMCSIFLPRYEEFLVSIVASFFFSPKLFFFFFFSFTTTTYPRKTCTFSFFVFLETCLYIIQNVQRAPVPPNSKHRDIHCIHPTDMNNEKEPFLGRYIGVSMCMYK